MSEEWSFEKDDFLTTTPYEALYAYHKEPFTHAAKMEELAAYSVSKGFKGFKTMYKKYVESLKAQSGTIYIDNVTNFTNQPLELNAGDWEADDSGIFKKNGYNDEVACPHPIMPVERLVNIDTGEEKLQLAFRKGTIWRKIIVSKTVLASSNKVTELAGSGIAVTSQNARAFIQYISDMENMNYYLIPEKKSIGRFGYIPDEGFSPFVDGLIFDGDANFKAMFQTVRSRGSEAKWLETAAEVREMSTTAKIILAASFASVLLEPLNCLPFFVHLWGVDSGTGKTVALMVAASVWGDPAVGAYVKTFDGTVVGMEKTAAFLNNLPFCLDELQLAMATRYDQTIFFLQLPAKGAIQFLLQVCYGIERRETKQLCADALHILITPETATGLICYKLVEHLYKRLPLIRYALFFALLDAGQIFNGHRAKSLPVNAATVSDGIGDTLALRRIGALNMDHHTFIFVIWISDKL